MGNTGPASGQLCVHAVHTTVLCVGADASLKAIVCA